MKKLSKLIVSAALVTALSSLSGYAVAEEQDCPERELVKAGVFHATVKSAGLIVGARWGEGTLRLLNGDVYNVEFKGGKLMEIGASNRLMSGTVYNLESVDDFSGLYLGIGGGLTAITASLGGTSVTNAKCVVINASTTDGKGLQVSMPIAPGGVDVKIVR